MFSLRALRVFVVRKMRNLSMFFHGDGLKGAWTDIIRASTPEFRH